MSITYTWAFPKFDVAKSEDGLTDVVKVIHWTYLGRDGEYTANAYGTVSLGPPNPDDFIPYADLTEQWAIDVCSNRLDIPQMEAALATQINNEKNPPIVVLPPPWLAQ